MKHLIKYTLILLASLTNIYGLAQSGSPIYDNVGENYFNQSAAGSDSLLQMFNSEMTLDLFWIKDNANVGDDFGGIVPTDIYYLEVANGNDKIYIYGKRNIVVVDAATKETMANITSNNGEVISAFSQYYPAIEQTQYLNYNHFAYNPNNELLYCVIENGNIIAINTNDDTFELIKENPTSVCGDLRYYNFFIKYDHERNWIYYTLSTALQNEVFLYNADDYSEMKGRYTFGGGSSRNIRALEVNPNPGENEFYISLNDEYLRIVYDPAYSGIHNNNNSDFYPIGTAYGTDNYAGNMLYVKQDNSNDKLFCFPNASSGGTLNYYILNLTTKTSETRTCPAKVTAACFDGNDNVYFSYVSNNNEADLMAIDVNDYSIVADVNTHNNDIDGLNNTLDIDMLNNKVLIAKTAEITIYDLASGNVDQVKPGENHYFSRIALAPDALTAYAINTWGTGLDAVDQAGAIDYSLNLGGIAYHACLNKYNGYIYFYNKHLHQTGKVYAFNTNTNNFTIIDIDGPISDIEIDPDSHKALVSTYNNSPFLKVIQDDQLLDSEYWLELDHSYINELYISPENNLYSVVGRQQGSLPTGIEIGLLDANDYTNISFLEYNTNNPQQEFVAFLTSNQAEGPRAEGSMVYAATDGESPATQLFLMINDEDLTQEVDQFSIAPAVFDIAYNKGSSTVYMAHEDPGHTLDLFNTKNGNEGSIQTLTFTTAIRDIESNGLHNFIYVLHGSSIDKLSGVSISTTPITGLYSLSSSMKFNTDNSMLYVHVVHVDIDCGVGDGGVYEIFDNNSGNPQIQYFANTNFHRPRYTEGSVIPLKHDIVFDNNAHKLYYGGAGHSNIIGMSMSFYQLPLRSPLTWLSIPRHQRPANPDLTPTEDVFAQENIAGGYTHLDIYTNKIIPGAPYEPDLVHAEWRTSPPPAGWHYDDDIVKDIHSSRGYKLEISQDNPHSSYLELAGSVQDPYTPVPLYCHEENWIGYFLYEEQSVFKALGDALPYVYQIEHQDYSCFRYNFPVPNCNAKSANDYPPGKWICDGTPNIRFGEMVIVKPYQDIPNFGWYQSIYPPSNYTRPEIVYYTYDEKADYSTFVIELDSTQEMPEEMGAFVNDSCVGACSLVEGDSVVVLRAYLGEQAGDSVVFQEHYASKSTNNIDIADYYVLNPESGIKEKRVVKTGENRDVFIVSFRNEQKDNTLDLNGLEFKIWPNPASASLFYSLMLEYEAFVNISIFDISGKLIANPLDELMPAGSLSGELFLTDFSGRKLKAGVYLMKAKIGDSVLIRKVIVK